MNLLSIQAFAVGIVAFALFFSINGVFLGHTFFKDEEVFLRFVFGVLLLTMLLGFIGWFIMIIYNLDITAFTTVLLFTSTFSSFLHKRAKNKNDA